MNPSSQVADMIMMLMRRGQSGGLPMQASPELIQYLAHAQGGTTPPQLRGTPAADVLPGPGSGYREINDPDFLNAAEGQLPDTMQYDSNGWPAGTESFAAPYQGPSGGNITPLDMVSDRPPSNAFRHAGGDGTEDQLWMWAMKDGKRVKIDGPFSNDIEAARELRAMRQAGLDMEIEIAPDFNPGPPRR